MTVERPGDQLPVHYAEPAETPGEDGQRRGPVQKRDDRLVALAIGSALALVLAALLVVAMVRTLANAEDQGETGSGPTGPLAALVPDVAAVPVLLAPDQQVVQLAELLNTRRHDVATAAPTPMLCAAVVLDAALEVSGRWERNGQEVAGTDLSRVGPPGFGDCVDDGGTPLDAGVYQFLVVDADGNESAAGTIVLGADVVNQQLVNVGSEPLCTIRLAPSRAGYFDAFDVAASPVAPGQSLTVPVAAVEHEIETAGCGNEGAVRSADFDPDPATPVALDD